MNQERPGKNIDRRQFLASSGAAGLVAACAPMESLVSAQESMPAGKVNRVAVVGVGIVGASIAYNLSKRGCEVVLIDKKGPASQASGNSFAWLNATYFDQPRSYFDLRVASINEYHRLAKEVDLPLRWGGSLEWYDSADTEAEMTAGVRRIQGYGSPTWMIDCDRVAQIEPNLNLGSDFKVAYSTRDGAIDPAATTRALVEKSVANGATPVFPATVTSIKDRRDGVTVNTNIDSFSVDLVVIAAGINANEFAAMVDLGSNLLNPATPGIIVTTRPMAPILSTVAYTGDTHIHQLNDGRFIVGEKAGPPSTSQHLAFLTDKPNVYPYAEISLQHARRALNTAGKYLPQLSNAEVEKVGVGWRPLPLDGLPIVGRPKMKPSIYLAAMHSGVTLAPIIGRFAATEILDGVTVDALADFRLERLL
jgi:glycine/D-amino acid oxidase-like deaminating enzyme